MYGYYIINTIYAWAAYQAWSLPFYPCLTLQLYHAHAWVPFSTYFSLSLSLTQYRNNRSRERCENEAKKEEHNCDKNRGFNFILLFLVNFHFIVICKDWYKKTLVLFPSIEYAISVSLLHWIPIYGVNPYFIFGLLCIYIYRNKPKIKNGKFVKDGCFTEYVS